MKVCNEGKRMLWFLAPYVSMLMTPVAYSAYLEDDMVVLQPGGTLLEFSSVV